MRLTIPNFDISWGVLVHAHWSQELKVMRTLENYTLAMVLCVKDLWLDPLASRVSEKVTYFHTFSNNMQPAMLQSAMDLEQHVNQIY